MERERPDSNFDEGTGLNNRNHGIPRIHFASIALAIVFSVGSIQSTLADESPALRMLSPGKVVMPDGSESLILPDTLPFGVGEVLDFDIQYGVVNVGRARLETSEIKIHRGRNALGILSRAKSAKWIDSVYKVRDEISSLMDLEMLHSLRFAKRLREGKYKADMEAEYHHEEGLARYADGSEEELLPGSQDILTALFYVRSFPLTEGMTLHIPVHDGKKSYPLRVKVVGREQVVTAMGEFECLVLEPYLESGGLFKSEGRMQVFMSADERRLPVKLKAKAPVGAFTSELKEYRPGEPLRLPGQDDD